MIRITLAALLGIYSINFAQADISSIIGDTIDAAKTAASTVKDSAAAAASSAKTSVTNVLNKAKTKAVEKATQRVRTSISNIQTKVQAQLQTAKNSANTQATEALTKANESYNEALNNLNQLEATLQQKTTANVAETKQKVQQFASSISSNLTSAKIQNILLPQYFSPIISSFLFPQRSNHHSIERAMPNSKPRSSAKPRRRPIQE